jgi:hypothetical protein
MKIYCHWDGYLDNNGQLLRDHYTDPAKLLSLMLLGDISSLRPEIGEGHDFDVHYQEGDPRQRWCVAYGRDRGEKETGAKVYADFAHYRKDCQFEEYNYIWRNGEWYVEFHGCEGGYVTLAEAFDIQAEIAAE